MGLKSGSKSGKGVKQGSTKLGVSKIQSSRKQVKSDEPDIDTSVMRPSIEISVSGVPQLVQAYQGATEELKSILARECDIIYECRVCRNLFRSLANMMAHKRVYCKSTYSYSKRYLNQNHMVDDYTVVIEPEPAPTNSQDKQSWITSDAEPGPLSQTEVVQSQIVKTTTKISSTANAKKGLREIVDRLTRNSSETLDNKYASAAEMYDDINKSMTARKNDRLEHSYHLEDIETTKVGKFQTKIPSSSICIDKEDLMKAQVSELQNMTSQHEAVLGPDGRLLDSHSPLSIQNSSSDKISETQGEEKSSKDDHVCPDCNVKFSTRKTLNHHMKSLHVTFRLCYPCPCCKSTFVNPWSVYRHLYKVHRKTAAQVRRLRPQIQKKAFRKEFHNETPVIEGNTKSDAIKELQRLDQENQAWMDNFEDDLELQRCGGCGRRFERRAALNSHSQICQKRIAARNNLKPVRNVPSTSTSNKVTKLCNTEDHILGSDLNKKSNDAPKTIDSVHDITNSFAMARARQSTGSNWVEQQKKEVREKKIEIQIRKDYCKMSSSSSVIALSNDTQSEPSSRPPSCIVEDEVCYGNERDWDSSMEMEEENKDESDSEDSSSPNIQHSEILINEDTSEKEDEKSVQNSSSCDSSESGINLMPVIKHADSAEEFNLEKDKNCPEIAECSRKRRISNDDDSRQINHIKRTRKNLIENQSVSDIISDISFSSKTKKLEQFHPIMEARMKKLINIRRLQCLPCQKKFIKLTNLRRHVAVHIGWCRYRCVLCPFKCFSKYDCVDHVSKIHLKGSQRNKSVAMVEYIEEQESETVTNSCEVEDVKEDMDQMSQFDEMTENLAIEVSSLNLEDIKNIVGVINYDEEVKITKDTHPINNQSPDRALHDTGNTNEVAQEHTCVHAVNTDSKSSENLEEIEEDYIKFSGKGNEATETCSEIIEEKPCSEKIDSNRLVNLSEDSCSSTAEVIESVIENLIDSATQIKENVHYNIDKKEQTEIEEVTPVCLEQEIECHKETKYLDIETDKISNLCIEESSNSTEKLCIDDIPYKTEYQPLSPCLAYDEHRSESPVLKTDEPSVKPEMSDSEKESASSELNSESNEPRGSKETSQINFVNMNTEKESYTKDSSDEEICDLDVKEETCSEGYEPEDLEVAELSESSANIEDGQNELRKMVMEVIFGSGVNSDHNVNQKLYSVSMNGDDYDCVSMDGRISSTSSSSDPDIIYDSSTHLSSAVPKISKTKFNVDHSATYEAERRERPIRNRVKVTKEDFIYDFTDSFTKKDDLSKVVKKKQTDSGKESAKIETSTLNCSQKTIPKLMLVRTDSSESVTHSHIPGPVKGTWSSVYAPNADYVNSKTCVASSSQIYNSRKVPRTHDVKP